MKPEEIEGIKTWWAKVDPGRHDAVDVALQGMHDVPDLIAALEAAQEENTGLRNDIQDIIADASLMTKTKIVRQLREVLAKSRREEKAGAELWEENRRLREELKHEIMAVNHLRNCFDCNAMNQCLAFKKMYFNKEYKAISQALSDTLARPDEEGGG